MSEPPVCTPSGDQKGELLPQDQPATSPQVQPVALDPQCQLVHYPQGQAVAYQPGQPRTYPQVHPWNYPPDQPGTHQTAQLVTYPSGQPGTYPPGQPGTYPQGQPYYPQSQPLLHQQGQPGVYPPGQQQVMINQPGNTGRTQGCCGSSTIDEHYNATAGLATGVIHLVIGALSLILVVVAFYLIRVHEKRRMALVLWTAIILYIPTGILGVASKKQDSCVIIAYMVFAIFSVFGAIGILFIEIGAAVFLGEYGYYGSMLVHRTLAFLGLAECIISIVSAIFCCKGSSFCCAPPPTIQAAGATTAVLYAPPQAQTQAGMVGPPLNQTCEPKAV